MTEDIRDELIKEFPPIHGRIRPIKEVVERYLLRILVTMDFNREHACRVAGVSRRTMYNYVKRYEKMSGKKFPYPSLSKSK